MDAAVVSKIQKQLKSLVTDQSQLVKIVEIAVRIYTQKKEQETLVNQGISQYVLKVQLFTEKPSVSFYLYIQFKFSECFYN